MRNGTTSPQDTTQELLQLLSEYIREHQLSNKALAHKLDIPYNTLKKWRFFTAGKETRRPSEPHLNKIREFLKTKEKPELFSQIKEARHRTERIKYLLILLEDELSWFRSTGLAEREEYRKELNASDIGYISSLLTMLTDEEKFNRWIALTTARFNAFKGK